MQIIVLANEEQEQEIKSAKIIKGEIDFRFIRDFSKMGAFKDADAFLWLHDDIPANAFENIMNKPIIINSVTETLQSLNPSPNVSRINGWPGFLKRSVWEVASYEKVEISKVFRALDWEFYFVKDEPGLVAARVLCMIINEAYFALGEKISTREEIDLAMKLGTNYPYGPFEWEDKIGPERIYNLLQKLSAADIRYLPAPLFKQKFVHHP